MKRLLENFDFKDFINVSLKRMKKLPKQIKDVAKRYVRTNVLFSSFIITSLLNATLLRYLTVKNYFDLNPIIADLAVLLIIGAFGYFIKPKHQFKYYFTWSIVFTVLCIVNSMYYTNYVSFASISLLATSAQVVDVSDAVFENIMELKDFSYIWQIAAMIYVHSILCKKKYYDHAGKIEIGKVRAVNTLIAGVILVGLFISTLNSVDISRLSKQWNREFVVLRFGLYTYQINDIFSSVKSQISPLFGYDENAKLFREYYASKESTTKTNKYTNIFKGKNVIVIHAESIQNFVLNASFNGIPVAPNLKRIASEGIYFSNFYAQESVGTSSDTEFTFNTSLMPTSNGTVFVNYFDREYLSIEKLLKEQNYYTFSMHGNNGTFWNRNVMHKSLGYNKYFSYPDSFTLDEKLGLGLSDQSFFNQAVPKIKAINEKNTNFFGTMLMLSNHTPFTAIEEISTYEVDYKYEQYNPLTKQMETVSAPYLEGTKMGSYMKSVNYADQAIGDFITNLDNNGLLENTVIVIYGDHDSKLKKNEFIRYNNYDPYTDTVLDKKDPAYQDMDYYQYELNRKVPFIIWTKGKKFKTEVKKVMGMVDALPTLANMLGVNNKYALGNDIFNVDENVVIFPDSNWLTDKMYYNSQKQEGFILKEGDTIGVDYIDKYNQKADQVISVSEAIIIYDLIKKTNETNLLIEEYGGD